MTIPKMIGRDRVRIAVSVLINNQFLEEVVGRFLHVERMGPERPSVNYSHLRELVIAGRGRRRGLKERGMER